MARARGKSSVKSTPIPSNLIDYRATGASSILLQADDTSREVSPQPIILPNTNYITPNNIIPDDSTLPDPTPIGPSERNVKPMLEDEFAPKGQTTNPNSHGGSGNRFNDYTKGLLNQWKDEGVTFQQAIEEFALLYKDLTDSEYMWFSAQYGVPLSTVQAAWDALHPKPDVPKLPSTKSDEQRKPTEDKKPIREDENLKAASIASRESKAPGESLYAQAWNVNGKTNFQNATRVTWISNLGETQDDYLPYLFISRPNHPGEEAEHMNLASDAIAKQVIDTTLRNAVAGPDLPTTGPKWWLGGHMPAAARDLPMIALLQYLNGEYNTPEQNLVGDRVQAYAAKHNVHQRQNSYDDRVWQFFMSGGYKVANRWNSVIGDYIQNAF